MIQFCEYENKIKLGIVNVGQHFFIFVLFVNDNFVYEKKKHFEQSVL